MRAKAHPGEAEGVQAPLNNQDIGVYFLSFSSM